MDPTVREEDQVWKRVLGHAARRLPRPIHRPLFADWLIVAMYLWSVWHGQCLSWACERAHYGRLFRPRKLPSISQFTRRIRNQRSQQVLQAVHAQLAPAASLCPLYIVDGKAMLVSPVSKDRQATRCKVCGTYVKGYRLHAVGQENDLIPLWAVTSLSQGECPVAEVLCGFLPPQADDALMLGNTNYDDKGTGKVLAQRNCGYLTPPKGQGQHPVTLRQMGPVRREMLGVWQSHSGLAQLVLRARLRIENIFSQLCDLSRLPAFVRGLERVRRWGAARSSCTTPRSVYGWLQSRPTERPRCKRV